MDGEIPEQPKKPIGRPTKYKPEYCEKLIEHMGQGLSFESFAAKVDTCRATLYEWSNSYPDFLDAHKKGMEKALLFMEEMGLTNMNVPPGSWSQSVYIFFMKARFGYRDGDKQASDELNKKAGEQNEKLAVISKQFEEILNKK